MKKIVQVYPTNNFMVYLYFSDGKVKLYDTKEIISKGGVFKPLENIEVFKRLCTVMNGTLAWDISEKRDPYNCIDLDPEELYQKSVAVTDPLEKIA